MWPLAFSKCIIQSPVSYMVHQRSKVISHDLMNHSRPAWCFRVRKNPASLCCAKKPTYFKETVKCQVGEKSWLGIWKMACAWKYQLRRHRNYMLGGSCWFWCLFANLGSVKLDSSSHLQPHKGVVIFFLVTYYHPHLNLFCIFVCTQKQ